MLVLRQVSDKWLERKNLNTFPGLRPRTVLLQRAGPGDPNSFLFDVPGERF